MYYSTKSSRNRKYNTSGDVLCCFTPAGKGTSLAGATFLVVFSAAAASVSLASPSLGQALGAGRGGSSHPACLFACAGTTCTSLLKQSFYRYIYRYTSGHHHLPKPQAFYVYNMLKIHIQNIPSWWSASQQAL